MKQRSTTSSLWWAAVLVVAALFVCGQAGAQGTTATIRGTVADANGPVPGAKVVAVSTQSGFQHTATSGGGGAFTLAGLTPGTYELKVDLEGYHGQAQTVQLLLGQTLSVKVDLKPQTVVLEGVTVVGAKEQLLIDTRSSAVATNITPQQIESLPQNNRNFLSFAGLAPGVRFTDDTDAQGQQFGSGAANPKQVNVFIDGLSYKNDIIKGGAFMQDSSRGNPFPQGAVQEYQVLTQNYKAEYEKASAAVITAVTKSGGNAFHGDVLYLYQSKDMVAQDQFAKDRGDSKPPYKRNQYEISLGGPLIKDQLHFFLSFEQNNRDVVNSVFRGPQYDQAPDNVKGLLNGYETGSMSSPLKSKLYFGKLTLQPSVSQTMDFSYNKRDEDEIRDFGGQRVKEGARDFKIGTDAVVLRHLGVVGGNAYNEASLTYQKLSWRQIAFDQSKPHENYIGLLDIGAPDYVQNLAQKRTGLRDDFSYAFNWMGSHSVKTGVVVNWSKYDLTKAAFYNPYFEFRSDEKWQIPYKAVVGFGDPALSFSNTQYGIFWQDEWRPTSNFTASIGLRWDYETNMLNNKWVTPADVASGLRTACRHYDTPVGGKSDWCVRDIFDVNSYISTGSNRSSYKNMYQPRLGFTWDPEGAGRTVVFGGWGLYYDRVTLNDIYDEQYRHVWKQYTLCFTSDPAKVGTNTGCGVKNLLWDPSYLSGDALRKLIASGKTPGPEVYLLNNDTRPPRSNQWTIGVRQQFGSWLTSFTYANSRGKNGLVWSFGSLPPGTAFNDRWGNSVPIPGYGFILRSYNTRETKYDGYFLTFDKPFTAESNWGANIAYTYSKGYQNASLDEGTAFAFDALPGQWPLFPANSDERNRLVMSGTVGLPYGFKVSGLITLGSGTPYSIPDASQGWGKFVFRMNEGRPKKYSFIIPDAWAYRSVDLRLEWGTAVGGGMRLGIIGEAFNIFDYKNYYYSDWVSGFRPPPGETNANYGKPTGAYNTRRFQVGARVSF